jgi:hypothetical protein
VLGDQEVNEQADPSRQCGVRARAGRQEGRAGLRASLDLVPVDGDDEVRPSREVPVYRARADPCLGRDLAYRRVYA